ncbi:MAG: hypothetical protein Q9N62_07570 [Ghiorsea sp.]|nr:hypothetical protein [Ghiorsea sp.]
MGESALFLIINKLFSLLETIAKFGLPTYGFIEIMPYLAGETTIISMIFSQGSKSNMLPWLLTSAVVFWALFERFFRYSKTNSLTKRIQSLEKKIDPKRSSSGLTPEGLTHPEDKVL